MSDIYVAVVNYGHWWHDKSVREKPPYDTTLAEDMRLSEGPRLEMIASWLEKEPLIDRTKLNAIRTTVYRTQGVTDEKKNNSINCSSSHFGVSDPQADTRVMTSACILSLVLTAYSYSTYTYRVNLEVLACIEQWLLSCVVIVELVRVSFHMLPSSERYELNRVNGLPRQPRLISC